MGNSCKLGFFGMLYFIKHDGTKHQEDAKPLIVDLNWTNHSVGQNGIWPKCLDSIFIKESLIVHESEYIYWNLKCIMFYHRIKVLELTNGELWELNKEME